MKMNKIVIYKGKLEEIIKQMKEDLKNGKDLASDQEH